MAYDSCSPERESVPVAVVEKVIILNHISPLQNSKNILSKNENFVVCAILPKAA